MMRRAGVIILVAVGLSAPALGQQPGSAPVPAPSVQDTATRRPSEGVATEAEASRLRTQNREREWDRKMRASTNSICKGC
jgi:hypothetical protein